MDEMMLQYRHRKDLQEMARVQGMQTKRRLLHKDMASFNLDVAKRNRVGYCMHMHTVQSV